MFFIPRVSGLRDAQLLSLSLSPSFLLPFRNTWKLQLSATNSCCWEKGLEGLGSKPTSGHWPIFRNIRSLLAVGFCRLWVDEPVCDRKVPGGRFLVGVVCTP